MLLTVTTVNIGACAPARAEKILNWLTGRDDDVIVLTETSPGPGTAWILDQYRNAGYAVAHQTDPAGDRGCAIVSRVEASVPTAVTAMLNDISIPARIAGLLLDTDPAILVCGVYIPSRDASAAKVEKKQTFLNTLLAALKALPEEFRTGLILAGDYNIIARSHVPRYPTFLAFEYDAFDTLAELGLIDTTLHLEPAAQPHSWIGRTGDGYRYDYIHAATGLVDRARSSTYLHETRELGLTDHAAVTTTFEVTAVERLAVTDPQEADQGTLF